MRRTWKYTDRIRGFRSPHTDESINHDIADAAILAERMTGWMRAGLVGLQMDLGILKFERDMQKRTIPAMHAR
jgi:hypothetical protein